MIPSKGAEELESKLNKGRSSPTGANGDKNKVRLNITKKPFTCVSWLSPLLSSPLTSPLSIYIHSSGPWAGLSSQWCGP